MNWKIITIGRPALAWAKAGVDDYVKRLSRSLKLEWVVLREGPARVTTKRMLEASEGCRRLVLDERGVAWRSVALAGWISQQEQQGVKRAALLIGGAEGHSDEVRAAADVCWSLSALTLQHELALLVAMEQLYRAGTIQRGEPYHREG
jgi:23S rRNA (pseudouridine1915-N3)-methyltransferase